MPLRDEGAETFIQEMFPVAKRVASGGAQSGVNLMPAMLQAVRAYATVGEITNVLKGVFGEFQEPARW